MNRGEQRNDPSRKRRYTRFRPDRLTTAKVQMDSDLSSFVSDSAALVFEESFGGCCLILICDRPIQVHDRWKVQVGSLHPMLGEVVWISRIDEYVFKVGIKFLE